MCLAISTLLSLILELDLTFAKEEVVGFTYGSGLYSMYYENSSKFGNSFHSFIEIVRKNPNVKFFVHNVGPAPLVILVDPQLIQNFLQNQRNFEKPWYVREIRMQMTAESLVWTSDHEKWKQARKLLGPHFHFDLLKRSVPMIVKVVRSVYSTWINKANREFDAIEMFSEVSGEVILRYLFNTSHMESDVSRGKSITRMAQEVNSAYAKANSSLGRILFGGKIVEWGLFSSHRDFIKKREECMQICRRLLEEAKKKGLQDYQYLYTLEEAKKLKVQPYTDERILHEFIQLLFAGTDNNARTLAFATYFLSQHPETLEKLKEEIDKNVYDCDQIDLATINRLNYAEAIIKETLRLVPIFPLLFIREAMKDHDFGDFVLKKGDYATFFIPLSHMCEKYFTNPTQFIPERWMPEDPFPNDGWKKEPYAYLPFSGGSKGCIGQHLAMIEAKLMIALFIKTFKFSFPKDYKLRLLYEHFMKTLDPLTIIIEPI